MPFEITTDKLYRGIPGSNNKQPIDLYRLAETKTLPPPPTLPHLPAPPPKVLHDGNNEKQLGNILKTVT